MTKQTFLKIRLLFFFIPLLLSTSSLAQKRRAIFLNENNQTIQVKKLDSVQIANQTKKILAAYYNRGFLSASLDSQNYCSESAIIHIYTGKKYILGAITFENKHFDFKKYPKSINKLQKFESELLKTYYTNGYITTQINKKVSFSNDSVHIRYNTEKGPRFFYDSLICKNNIVSINYLQNFTGIKPGHIADWNKLLQIHESFEQSNILSLDSAETKFNADKIRIKLHIKKQSTNSMSGILGFQNNENKLETTGSIDLQLINQLKIGEQLSFKWKKNKALSQQINVAATVPYILHSNIDISGKLHIIKEDTSFTNTNIQLGGSTQIAKNTQGSVFFNYQNSAVNTTTDSLHLKSSAIQYYGLGLRHNSLKKMHHPQKGMFAALQFFVGEKKQFNSGASSSKTLSIKSTFDVQKAISLKTGTLILSNQSGIIWNDSLKMNETFILGGINNYKGFNENSIFAKSYSLFALEHRIALNSNSYGYWFINSGFSEEFRSEKTTTYSRQAVGIGLYLQIKAGIFNINYAIGKLSEESLNIKNGKIHIAYISTF